MLNFYCRHLGTRIGDQLTWSRHGDNIRSTVIKYVGIFHEIRSKLPRADPGIGERGRNFPLPIPFPPPSCPLPFHPPSSPPIALPSPSLPLPSPPLPLPLEVGPLIQLEDLGNAVSTSGVRGIAPAAKAILAYLEPRKSI